MKQVDIWRPVQTRLYTGPNNATRHVVSRSNQQADRLVNHRWRLSLEKLRSLLYNRHSH